jgi:dTDP-4-amino-4,6-dideoxygalactose transaminase
MSGRPEPPVPHSRPWITAADIRAVAAVLRRAHPAQGEEVRGFEAEVGRLLELPPGVAVSSGTAALHLALLGLGVGPGDEVIVPSYVCVAPLHAIEYTGAAARLVDADPATYNLDPDDVRQRLTRRTRAVIVPHLFGCPADLKPLLDLEVPLVEDCAQAVGARMGGRPVGSFGAVTVASFYATKLLTSGEGGMVLSRSARLLSRVRDLRDYDERRRHRIRFNYKLTDMQAALGRSQLRRLPAMLRRRAAIAARYRRAWGRLPVALPEAPAGSTHAYHRFVLASRLPATALVSRLGALGIVARRPVFRPLHRVLGLDGFPGASAIFRHAVSLPLYPALTRREEARVAAAVLEALR